MTALSQSPWEGKQAAASFPFQETLRSQPEETHQGRAWTDFKQLQSNVFFIWNFQIYGNAITLEPGSAHIIPWTNINSI